MFDSGVQVFIAVKQTTRKLSDLTVLLPLVILRVKWTPWGSSSAPCDVDWDCCPLGTPSC